MFFYLKIREAPEKFCRIRTQLRVKVALITRISVFIFHCQGSLAAFLRNVKIAPAQQQIFRGIGFISVRLQIARL